MKKDVAVVFLNYIQYVSIVPTLEKLTSMGYKVDYYCLKDGDPIGFDIMFNDFKRMLREKQIKIYEKALKCEYKVLLEPYPIEMGIRYKYRIKYAYSLLSAKPNKVYFVRNLLLYDAILCFSKCSANYLSVFSKTFLMGNQKYGDIYRKKNNKNSKKVLLYLPTYGEESSINLIAKEFLKLKEKYYVISKVHHCTTYLKNEKEQLQKVKDGSDEFYNTNEDLGPLLSRADVVLTDNSGAIFEALYTNTPIAIIADDINKNKYYNFNTTQYELVQKGIIPYTNNPDDLLKIVAAAMSSKYYEAQKKWNKENFYHPKDKTKDSVSVIINYINDNIDERYQAMHDILKNEYYLYKDSYDSLEIKEKEYNDKIESLKLDNDKIQIENNHLKEQLEIYKLDNDNLKEQLNYYKTGKLYKIANKIYRIKNGEEK
ncbi:MAG: hypothetical protein GX951_04530 [Mollicutes bacterium]|nr:hypothetical protein [Mollicutes bacterium]